MTIISNKFGKGATLRTTANVTIALTDLSIDYDGDQVGTVQLQGSNAVGTDTLFQTTFANGDFVYVVVNSSTNDTRVINKITSNTLMNVTSAFSNTNAATTYRKSETIDFLDIRGVKFASNRTWTVMRGSNTVMVLTGTDHWNLGADGQAVTDDHSGSIVANLSVSSTGTLIMDISKKSRTSNTLLVI